MEWQMVKSLEELRQLGKLKEVVVKVQDELKGIKVPKNSWKNLWDFIQTYTEEKASIPVDKSILWEEISTVEDLKKLGKLKDVKSQLEEELGTTIKGKTWNEIYTGMNVFLNKEKQYNSPYFKDEISEMIFYLLELEGELKSTKLGITKLHYKDKKEASQWKNELMKKIHPDQNNHMYAEEATKELNKIYGSMIKFAK